MLIQFHFSGNKKVLIATKESRHEVNSPHHRSNNIQPQAETEILSTVLCLVVYKLTQLVEG